MTGFRVPDRGRVDRTRPLGFSFDGRAYSGFAGDTLASALMANGVMLLGRSFKYHRPRGLLAAGSEEPNGLVTVDRGSGRSEPNTRATMQELFPGLRATSQNRWPSLRRDAGAASDLLHAFLPTGFYYKTFLWPPAFWGRIYEPLIRRAAGLGQAPSVGDPNSYSARYAHCEVLVVGAGPAGLAAALSASATGARTFLVDEQSEPGGWLLADAAAEIEGRPASEWLKAARKTLASRPNAKVLVRTTAIGAYHANMVVLAERLGDHLEAPPAGLPRERLWRVRARSVVLATGATERPIVFTGNDRPGIMLAGAARTLLDRYGVAVGRQAVVFTRDDSAWEAAFDLASAGIGIAAIVDLRHHVEESLAARARALGISAHLRSAIAGTSGRHGVRSVSVDGETGRRIFPCDAVLVCGGWSPNVHLFSQGRGTLIWRDDIDAHVPAKAPDQVAVAGAANGTRRLGEAIAEGMAVGLRAAGETGSTLPHARTRARAPRFGRSHPGAPSSTSRTT